LQPIGDIVVFDRAEVDLEREDFNRIGGKVPILANVKPHGKVKLTNQ